MKKLLFNLTFQFTPTTDAVAMVDSIVAVNDELVRRGYSVDAPIAATRSAPAPKKEQGPLEKHWCAENDVRGVRRTDGRTSEQQAEYNLRHYLNYTDEEIAEVLSKAPPVSIPNEEISPQSGVVEESEDDNEEKGDEASLF